MECKVDKVLKSSSSLLKSANGKEPQNRQHISQCCHESCGMVGGRMWQQLTGDTATSLLSKGWVCSCDAGCLSKVTHSH